MAVTDLTQYIEQIPELEEYYGLILSSLSAFHNTTSTDSNVIIRGQLDGKTRRRTALHMQVTIVAAVYDSQNRMIAEAGCHQIVGRRFPGFVTFESEEFSLPISDVMKIKVYPRCPCHR